MSIFADNAPYYVGLGWKILPLAEGSKLPVVKGGHGFKDATDDADQILAWGKKYPLANIGVATGKASGIIVIDFDPRNGGYESMAKLAGRNFVFPYTAEARTGNKGCHLYFEYEAGIKANKDKLGKGIDVKTDGGYVVAPPSVLKGGGQYRWLEKLEPKLQLPRLPHWVRDRLIAKIQHRPKFEERVSTTFAARSLDGMAKLLAGMREGNRNATLNWAAFTAGDLVRQGKLAPSEVESRLTQAGLSAGLTLSEIQATLASGLKAGQQRGQA